MLRDTQADRELHLMLQDVTTRIFTALRLTVDSYVEDRTT